MDKLFNAAEKHKQIILDAERYIWQNPETGYKEVKTSKYLENAFKDLGYNLTVPGDIPGFYTTLDTGKEGPCVLIMGELDSIICPEHPESDKETGAVHSCGHNAQCAALLGVAAALKEENALDGLCGKIMLCAVPAEELLEIEYRASLKEKGIIKYFGGKPEFLRRGYFDDADIAILVHTASCFMLNEGSVGCVTKRIMYKGKAAHAGGAPWDGVNAVYAANCGINAVNAIRETFKDFDHIRVHPIITSGGNMVNAIPSEAVLESYVRGKTFDAILDANKKVNRAFCGAALSLGANVEICDEPGYAPLVNDKNLISIMKDAAKLALPETELVVNNIYSTGSTDMGDLSVIMPTIMPYAGGAVGTSHGKDYYIENPVAACVDNAKWQLAMVYILLSNGAEKANEIIKNFEPQFSLKEEYLSFLESIFSSGDRIDYSDDEAKVVLK